MNEEWIWGREEAMSGGGGETTVNTYYMREELGNFKKC